MRATSARSNLHLVPEPALDRLFEIHQTDAFEWLRSRAQNSIHAVVTDPPYGLLEYTDDQKQKLRVGSGGVWRIPPSFDGCVRWPLPRFTILKDQHNEAAEAFFSRLPVLRAHVLVPVAPGGAPASSPSFVEAPMCSAATCPRRAAVRRGHNLGSLHGGRLHDCRLGRAGIEEHRVGDRPGILRHGAQCHSQACGFLHPPAGSEWPASLTSTRLCRCLPD